MTKDKGLPKDWPEGWPQNLEEFKQSLKDDDLIRYLEERGIELRYNEKTDKVTITKRKFEP